MFLSLNSLCIWRNVVTAATWVFPIVQTREEREICLRWQTTNRTFSFSDHLVWGEGQTSLVKYIVLPDKEREEGGGGPDINPLHKELRAHLISLNYVECQNATTTTGLHTSHFAEEKFFKL